MSNLVIDSFKLQDALILAIRYAADTVVTSIASVAMLTPSGAFTDLASQSLLDSAEAVVASALPRPLLRRPS